MREEGQYWKYLVHVLGQTLVLVEDILLKGREVWRGEQIWGRLIHGGDDCGGDVAAVMQVEGTAFASRGDLCVGLSAGPTSDRLR